ncbi:MAG: hypothetical protein HYY86_02235 [Candidatus Harrisonbacteria bacterium]|nr:hypothetical protein [Candidatus Harrisonbacteria bacterium]
MRGKPAVVTVTMHYLGGDSPYLKAKLNREISEQEYNALFRGLTSKGAEKSVYYDQTDDTGIYVAKSDNGTWGEAKSYLVKSLKKVFGGATSITIIEPQWKPVAGQKATILTGWNWGGFKVKFAKKISKEQCSALSEEIAPEGPVENGITEGEVKRTGIEFSIEDAKLEDVVKCLKVVLKKILGQNIKIVHKHEARKLRKYSVPCMDCKKLHRGQDELCDSCREEDEGYQSVIREEAALDPTGPAAYIISGGHSELRRGWS